MGLLIAVDDMPPFTSLIHIGFVTVIVLVIANQVRSWYRLRHIPGPRIAAWSTWWQLREALSGQYHERLKQASDAYGTSHPPK